MSGAPNPSDIEEMLRNVGFESVSITLKEESREFIKHWVEGSGAEEFVVSANIEARKPMSAATDATPQSIFAAPVVASLAEDDGC